MLFYELPIHTVKWPLFALHIDAYYDNSYPVDADKVVGGPRATVGPAIREHLEVRGDSKAAGTGDKASGDDYPAAYVNRAAIKMASKDKRGACADLEKADGLGDEMAIRLFEKYCR